MKLDIERTRRDLNQHLAELKVELGELQRTAAKVAAGVVAVIVVYKVAKFLWRRGRR